MNGHLAIILCAIILGFSVVTGTYIFQRTTQSSKEDMYKGALTSAVDSGMKAGELTDGCRFETVKKREESLDAFYNSFARNLGDIEADSRMTYQTFMPVILMLDEDGFYINAEIESSDHLYDHLTSSIYTWTKTYGTYNVRFYLSDYVKVLNTVTKEVFSGYYPDVYEQMSYPYPLDFMKEKETFYEEKNLAIVDSVDQKLNFYINQTDRYRNEYGASYNFEIPRLENAIWENTIRHPIMVAFFQGFQSRIEDTYINNYSLSGTDIHDANICYVIKDGSEEYYHKENCSKINFETDEVIDSGSAKYLASKGYEPCPSCR